MVAKNLRVVVRDDDRDRVVEEDLEGVVEDAGCVAKGFVPVVVADCRKRSFPRMTKGKQKKGGKDERAGAHLDGDLPISTNAHQFRVLAEREAVSDSLGTQQNGIEEVLIGPNAVAERLACVEDERY